MRGKLIVLEGLDGSGKTTQTQLLEQSVRSAGLSCRRVKFPCYDQPFSAPVRMYLNGEFGSRPSDVNAYAASSFFAVDRYASFRKFWRGDYESGTVILTDRYTASNLIYQLPKLPRGEWDSFFDWLRDFEFQKLGIPSPDLTVYLDMPQKISQKLLDERYRQNGGGRDIHENSAAFLTACRESAAYAAARLGWRTISCAEKGKLRSVSAIHGDVAAIVGEALGAPDLGLR